MERAAVSANDRQVILRYLQSVALIDSGELDDTRTVVQDFSRSQRTWLVQLASGRRVFVKRSRGRWGLQDGGLRSELLLYGLAAGYPNLRQWMPNCLWCDHAQQILVTEAVLPGDNVYIEQYRSGPSLAVAQQLGAMLASCHLTLAALPRTGLRTTLPWILHCMAPTGWLPAHAKLLLASFPLRQDLARALALACQCYQTGGVMHGDMKWSNCLAAVNAIKVIDWEYAGVGDPVWDLVGLLHEYVAFPIIVRCDEATIANLQAAAQALLAAYLRRQPSLAADDLSQRIARLTGVRLVQRAFEHAATTPKAPFVAALLACGLHIMLHPHLLLEGSVCQ